MTQTHIMTNTELTQLRKRTYQESREVAAIINRTEELLEIINEEERRRHT